MKGFRSDQNDPEIGARRCHPTYTTYSHIACPQTVGFAVNSYQAIQTNISLQRVNIIRTVKSIPIC